MSYDEQLEASIPTAGEGLSCRGHQMAAFICEAGVHLGTLGLVSPWAALYRK